MSRETYVGAPGFFLLNQACIAVSQAFNAVPYLVGSSITTKDHRDVDVRLILDDAEFDRIFGDQMAYVNPRVNALWSLLCSSISQHLAHASGLPIDFQIQSSAVSRTKYGAEKRIALGIFPEQ